MTDIFISYRRSDSAGYAGRLADSLESLLGPGRIFRDIEDIKPGEDFVQAIESNLNKTAVCLVVIGKEWLDSVDIQGQRRLDIPQDYVRIEIETALRLGVVVIPVLVGGVSMPAATELPGTIAGLANRQAIEITESRWDFDIERLLNVLTESPINLFQDKKLFRWSLFPGKYSRRFINLTIFSAAAAALFFVFKIVFSTPDLSGNWYFERGDYLLIKQDGNHVAVERIDPAMQTAYEKGTGMVKGRHLEFDLEPIYSQQFRYRGELTLSWGKGRLSGKLIEMLSNQPIPVELSRENPQGGKSPG